MIVIEKSEAGIGTFIAGLAIGAGIALLFAPHTEETRRDIERRARKVGTTGPGFRIRSHRVRRQQASGCAAVRRESS